MTNPGSLNFEQEVTRYHMTRERFARIINDSKPRWIIYSGYNKYRDLTFKKANLREQLFAPGTTTGHIQKTSGAT